MKKNVLASLRNYLNGDTTVDVEALRLAVEEEWQRGAEKAKANAAIYEDAEKAILAIMEDGEYTAREIYDSAKDTLPEGFTIGKVAYLLRTSPSFKVNKAEKGSNTYSLA